MKIFGKFFEKEVAIEKRCSRKVFVVGGIIVVVLFFVAVIYSSSRVAGRDEQRLLDLRAVREGLFYYYNENGNYPSSVSDWDQEKLDFGADVRTGANDYDNLASLISHLVPVLPKDPLNPANSPMVSETYLYRYVSSSDGRNFVIVFETEKEGDPSPMILKGW